MDPEPPWLEAIGDAFLLGIYEEALRMDPDDGEALQFLAHAYTRAGRHEEGLVLDRRLSVLHPVDPVVRYNLACSLALTGRTRDALDELERAIHLGYREADHMRADEDLASLRDHPRFLELLERIRG